VSDEKGERKRRKEMKKDKEKVIKGSFKGKKNKSSNLSIDFPSSYLTLFNPYLINFSFKFEVRARYGVRTMVI